MGAVNMLGNGTKDSSEEEIGGPIFEGQLPLGMLLTRSQFSRLLLSPILRIFTDPKRILTKKYLGHKPCMKGEHHMR